METRNDPINQLEIAHTERSIDKNIDDIYGGDDDEDSKQQHDTRSKRHETVHFAVPIETS